MTLAHPLLVASISYLLSSGFLFSILLSVRLDMKSLSLERSNLVRMLDLDFIMNLLFINFLCDEEPSIPSILPLLLSLRLRLLPVY